MATGKSLCTLAAASPDQGHDVKPNVSLLLVDVVSDHSQSFGTEKVLAWSERDARVSRAFAVAIELVQVPVHVRSHEADVMEVDFVLGAVGRSRITVRCNCRVRLFELGRGFEDFGSSLGISRDAVLEEMVEEGIRFCDTQMSACLSSGYKRPVPVAAYRLRSSPSHCSARGGLRTARRHC